VTVTVSPAEFHFVAYDSAAIAALADRVCNAIGLGDLVVQIDVDETTPLARVVTNGTNDNAITLNVGSGAFEDTRHPRRFSEKAAAVTIGRALIRAGDRRSEGFEAAPADEDLSLAEVAAWDVYAVGRLARLLDFVTIDPQRWRYNFRNRLGFSDAADALFDLLWRSDRCTWAHIESICERASA
jgi:hypothetical protein